MVTMDVLEQDNYNDYDTTPTTTPSIPYNEDFLDVVASSRLNLHGGFFRKRVTLVCLRQSTRIVIHGLVR